MKTFSSFILIVLFNTISYGQEFYNLKEGINYGQIQQIDSTEFFLIPKLIDKSNKSQFSLDRSYSSNQGLIVWTEIIFYDSKLNKGKKLLFPKPCLINSVTFYNKFYLNNSSAILNDYLLFLVRTVDYNKDGTIGLEDPVYLFISDKFGNNLTQISYNNFTIISWTFVNNGNTILLKTAEDKNLDSKFNDEDEEFYRLELKNGIKDMKLIKVTL